MKHMKLLRVAVVGFAVVAIVLVGGGIALAGGGGSGEQRAEGTFGKGPAASSPNDHATGEFKLRRRDTDSGSVEFRFEAKGEGIHTPQDITFCVGETNIDTDNPEDRGRWELDEDDRLDLDPQVVPDISIGTVTIREGDGCIDPDTVILTASLP